MRSRKRGRPRLDIKRLRCLSLACLLVGFLFGVNVVVHDAHPDELKRRFRCKRCGRTFNRRTWTPMAGLRTPLNVVFMAYKMYVRGSDISDIAYVPDVQDKTVEKWIRRLGDHCSQLLNWMLFRKNHHYTPGYIQLDELWSYEWTKKRKLWVWIVIDAASKLFVAFHVGKRDEESALKILRIAYDRFFRNPLLVTSDGLVHYIDPVRKWLKGCVYAPMVKRRENNRLVEIVKKIITSHTTKLGIGLIINTSYVERFNLTLRRGLSSLNLKTLSGAKKTSRLVGDLCIFKPTTT